MEPEGSSPHLQVPATRLYPEPAQFSPHAQIPPPKEFHVPLSLLRSYQNISPGPLLCLCIFRNKDTFPWGGVVSPSPKPQAGGDPLSAVRDCLFNTFATILHIGGRSSIRNLRTRHAVVTGTHLFNGLYLQLKKIVLASSTLATCFGHYWLSSDIKYRV
jgi:hypothetical protein